MIEDFLRGAGYLLDGYHLVLKPRLRRFVYVPLLVNTALFVIAITWSFRFLWGQVNSLLQRLPAWLDWLQWLLLPVFGLFVLAVLFFGFAFVANLVGAPFNGLLAERCEQRLGAVPVALVTRPWYREITVALVGELTKLKYYLVRAVPLLLLSLVPPVNLVASPALFVFTVWMLGLEYLDYPLGNHGLPFPEQRAAARQQRALVLGFGSAVLLFTLIPIVNFTVMPAAVAGATRLVWANQQRFLDTRR